MAITINGQPHPDGSPLTIGGVQASSVTVNGDTAWRNIVDVTVPQQAGLWILRDIIADAVDSGATNIRVTDDLIQPAMESGDLTGLVVELVNNGEIQASQSSGNAMNVTTQFKLTNNGWIKGGGGVGGAGANGANGADVTLEDTPVQAPYVEGVDTWDNFNSSAGYDSTSIFWSSSPEGVGYFISPAYNVTDTGYITSDVYGQVFPEPTRFVRGAFHHSENFSGNIHDYYSFDWRRQTFYTGGIGGTGGAGGAGEFYNSPAVPGVIGGAGQPSVPAGGNSGAKGYDGGAGGTFGLGGGNSGNGAVGAQPGYAIFGQSILHTDSLIGNTLGLLGNLY
jgi:hypothetical protein